VLIVLPAEFIIADLFVFSVFLDLHTVELPPDHSPINKEHIHFHRNSGSPLCSACENFASEAVTYLSEKQMQDKVLEFLHNACSQSFSLQHKVITFSI
jgi:saposin